jgi:hypothetical protein
MRLRSETRHFQQALLDGISSGLHFDKFMHRVETAQKISQKRQKRKRNGIFKEN